MPPASGRSEAAAPTYVTSCWSCCSVLIAPSFTCVQDVSHHATIIASSPIVRPRGRILFRRTEFPVVRDLDLGGAFDIASLPNYLSTFQAVRAHAGVSRPSNSLTTEKSVHQNRFFAHATIWTRQVEAETTRKNDTQTKRARKPHTAGFARPRSTGMAASDRHSAQRSRMLLAQTPTPGPRRGWCPTSRPEPAAGTMSSVPAVQPAGVQAGDGVAVGVGAPPCGSLTVKAAQALVAHGIRCGMIVVRGLQRLQEQRACRTRGLRRFSQMVSPVLEGGLHGSPGPCPCASASSSMRVRGLARRRRRGR